MKHPWLVGLAGLFLSWSHALAAEGNPTDHREIRLEPGWNLVVMPSLRAGVTLAPVGADVFLANSDRISPPPTQEQPELHAHEAYWVRVDEPTTWRLAAPTPWAPEAPLRSESSAASQPTGTRASTRAPAEDTRGPEAAVPEAASHPGVPPGTQVSPEDWSIVTRAEHAPQPDPSVVRILAWDPGAQRYQEVGLKTPLVPGQGYWVQRSREPKGAEATGGAHSPKNGLAGTAPIPNPPAQTPTPPTQASGTRSNHVVRLAWRAPRRFRDGSPLPEGLGFTYEVYRKGGLDPAFAKTAERKQPAYEDHVPLAHESYRYYVTAVVTDENGVSWVSGRSNIVDLQGASAADAVTPGEFETPQHLVDDPLRGALPQVAVARHEGALYSHLVYIAVGAEGGQDAIRYRVNRKAGKPGAWSKTTTIHQSPPGSKIVELALAAHQDLIQVAYVVVHGDLQSAQPKGAQSSQIYVWEKRIGEAWAQAHRQHVRSSDAWKRGLDLAFDRHGQSHMVFGEAGKVYYLYNFLGETDSEGQLVNVFDETKRKVNTDVLEYIHLYPREADCEDPCGCTQREIERYALASDPKNPKACAEGDDEACQPKGFYRTRVEETFVEHPSLYVDDQTVTIIGRQTRMFDNVPVLNPAWSGAFGPFVPGPRAATDADPGCEILAGASARKMGFRVAQRPHNYACLPQARANFLAVLAEEKAGPANGATHWGDFYAYSDTEHDHHPDWYQFSTLGRWHEEDRIKVAQRPLEKGAWSQKRQRQQIVPHWVGDTIEAKAVQADVELGFSQGAWRRKPLPSVAPETGHEPSDIGGTGAFPFEETLTRWRISTVDTFPSERAGDYVRCEESPNAALGAVGPSHPQLHGTPDGALHAVYEKGTSSNPNQPEGNALVHTVSYDGGRTWSAPNTIGQGYLPQVAATTSGRLAMLYYAPDPEASHPGFGRLHLTTWHRGEQREHQLSTGPAQPPHPRNHTLDSERLFAVPVLEAFEELLVAGWLSAANGAEDQGETIVLSRARDATAERQVSVRTVTSPRRGGQSAQFSVTLEDKFHFRVNENQTVRITDAEWAKGGRKEAATAGPSAGQGAVAFATPTPPLLPAARIPSAAATPFLGAAAAFGTGVHAGFEGFVTAPRVEGQADFETWGLAPEVLEPEPYANFESLLTTPVVWIELGGREYEIEFAEGPLAVSASDILGEEGLWVELLDGHAEVATPLDPRGSAHAFEQHAHGLPGNTSGNYLRALTLRDELLRTEEIDGTPTTYQVEYLPDPHLSANDSRYLAEAERVWAYTQGIALAQQARRTDDEGMARAVELARFLCREAERSASGAHLLGWHFSQNTKDDDWKDARLVTGANAWAIQGLGRFIESPGFRAQKSGTDRDALRGCYLGALEGLKEHRRTLQDGLVLMTAGWTTQGLAQARSPQNLPLHIPSHPDDPTEQWAYYDVLDAIGYETFPAEEDQKPRIRTTTLDGDAGRVASRTITLEKEDWLALKTRVKAQNVVTEHNLDVLSVLNHALAHAEALGPQDPKTRPSWEEDITRWRNDLRDAIFTHLWDDQHWAQDLGESQQHLKNQDLGRIVTGGTFLAGKGQGQEDVFVPSDHVAIDNCSWLALSVDFGTLPPLFEERLAKCLTYTIAVFAKPLPYEGRTYYGTHYFTNRFKDPYIEESALQETSYHLEATTGLILGLYTFKNARPGHPKSQAFGAEGGALWAGVQAFVRDWGFQYSSQRIQDLSTPLASSTAVVWFIDVYEYLQEQDQDLDRRLLHYALGRGAPGQTGGDPTLLSTWLDAIEHQRKARTEGDQAVPCAEPNSHLCTQDHGLAVLAALSQGNPRRAEDAVTELARITEAMLQQDPPRVDAVSLFALYAWAKFLAEEGSGDASEPLITHLLAAWHGVVSERFESEGSWAGLFTTRTHEEPFGPRLEDNVIAYFALQETARALWGQNAHQDAQTNAEQLQKRVRDAILENIRWDQTQNAPVLGDFERQSPSDRVVALSLYALFAQDLGDHPQARAALGALDAEGSTFDEAEEHAPPKSAYPWLRTIGPVLARRGMAALDPRQDELALKTWLKAPPGGLESLSEILGLLILEHPRGTLGVEAGPFVPEAWARTLGASFDDQETASAFLEETLSQHYLVTLGAILAADFQPHRFDTLIGTLIRIRFAFEQAQDGVHPEAWPNTFAAEREHFTALTVYEVQHLCEPGPVLSRSNLPLVAYLGVPCESLEHTMKKLIEARASLDPDALFVLLAFDHDEWAFRTLFSALQTARQGWALNHGAAFFGVPLEAFDPKPTLTGAASVVEVREAVRTHLQKVVETSPPTAFEQSGVDPVMFFHEGAPEYWTFAGIVYRQVSAQPDATEFLLSGERTERLPFGQTEDQTQNRHALRQLINRFYEGYLPAAAEASGLTPGQMHHALRTGTLSRQLLDQILTALPSPEAETSWRTRFEATSPPKFALPPNSAAFLLPLQDPRATPLVLWSTLFGTGSKVGTGAAGKEAAGVFSKEAFKAWLAGTAMGLSVPPGTLDPTVDTIWDSAATLLSPQRHNVVLIKQGVPFEPLGEAFHPLETDPPLDAETLYALTPAERHARLGEISAQSVGRHTKETLTDFGDAVFPAGSDPDAMALISTVVAGAWQGEYGETIVAQETPEGLKLWVRFPTAEELVSLDAPSGVLLEVGPESSPSLTYQFAHTWRGWTQEHLQHRLEGLSETEKEAYYRAVWTWLLELLLGQSRPDGVAAKLDEIRARVTGQGQGPASGFSPYRAAAKNGETAVTEQGGASKGGETKEAGTGAFLGANGISQAANQALPISLLLSGELENAPQKVKDRLRQLAKKGLQAVASWGPLDQNHFFQWQGAPGLLKNKDLVLVLTDRASETEPTLLVSGPPSDSTTRSHRGQGLQIGVFLNMERIMFKEKGKRHTDAETEARLITALAREFYGGTMQHLLHTPTEEIENALDFQEGQARIIDSFGAAQDFLDRLLTGKDFSGRSSALKPALEAAKVREAVTFDLWLQNYQRFSAKEEHDFGLRAFSGLPRDMVRLEQSFLRDSELFKAKERFFTPSQSLVQVYNPDQGYGAFPMFQFRSGTKPSRHFVETTTWTGVTTIVALTGLADEEKEKQMVASVFRHIAQPYLRVIKADQSVRYYTRDLSWFRHEPVWAHNPLEAYKTGIKAPLKVLASTSLHPPVALEDHFSADGHYLGFSPLEDQTLHRAHQDLFQKEGMLQFHVPGGGPHKEDVFLAGTLSGQDWPNNPTLKQATGPITLVAVAGPKKLLTEVTSLLDKLGVSQPVVRFVLSQQVHLYDTLSKKWVSHQTPLQSSPFEAYFEAQKHVGFDPLAGIPRSGVAYYGLPFKAYLGGKKNLPSVIYVAGDKPWSRTEPAWKLKYGSIDPSFAGGQDPLLRTAIQQGGGKTTVSTIQTPPSALRVKGIYEALNLPVPPEVEHHIIFTEPNVVAYGGADWEADIHSAEVPGYVKERDNQDASGPQVVPAIAQYPITDKELDARVAAYNLALHGTAEEQENGVWTSEAYNAALLAAPKTTYRADHRGPFGTLGVFAEGITPFALLSSDHSDKTEKPTAFKPYGYVHTSGTNDESRGYIQGGFRTWTDIDTVWQYTIRNDGTGLHRRSGGRPGDDDEVSYTHVRSEQIVGVRAYHQNRETGTITKGRYYANPAFVEDTPPPPATPAIQNGIDLGPRPSAHTQKRTLAELWRQFLVFSSQQNLLPPTWTAPTGTAFLASSAPPPNLFSHPGDQRLFFDALKKWLEDYQRAHPDFIGAKGRIKNHWAPPGGHSIITEYHLDIHHKGKSIPLDWHIPSGFSSLDDRTENEILRDAFGEDTLPLDQEFSVYPYAFGGGGGANTDFIKRTDWERFLAFLEEAKSTRDGKPVVRTFDGKPVTSPDEYPPGVGEAHIAALLRIEPALLREEPDPYDPELQPTLTILRDILDKGLRLEDPATALLLNHWLELADGNRRTLLLHYLGEQSIPVEVGGHQVRTIDNREAAEFENPFQDDLAWAHVFGPRLDLSLQAQGVLKKARETMLTEVSAAVTRHQWKVALASKLFVKGHGRRLALHAGISEDEVDGLADEPYYVEADLLKHTLDNIRRGLRRDLALLDPEEAELVEKIILEQQQAYIAVVRFRAERDTVRIGDAAQ